MIGALLLFLAQADGDRVSAINCDSPLDHPEITMCEARPLADAPQPDDECDDEPRSLDRAEACAARDFAAAEARLNEQWEETAAEMKRLDGELPAGGDGQPGYYATLVEAQRAWLAYREAECRSESFLVRGIPAQASVEAQCKAYLTEVRVNELTVLVSGLDL